MRGKDDYEKIRKLSAFCLADVNKIMIMVVRIVIGKEFIGAAAVLSTFIANFVTAEI
jgi:hypothetical protein